MDLNEDLASELLSAFRARGKRIAAVESCTGGLIMATLTAIAGSSDVVDCGFVTYTNEAKADLVNVPVTLLQAHGAVSAEVAAAMAKGGLAQSESDVCVSVTGIAGPGGATETKPVGLVFIGCAGRTVDGRVERFVFAGDRAAVRAQSVTEAFRMAQEVLSTLPD